MMNIYIVIFEYTETLNSPHREEWDKEKELLKSFKCRDEAEKFMKKAREGFDSEAYENLSKHHPRWHISEIEFVDSKG